MVQEGACRCLIKLQAVLVNTNNFQYIMERLHDFCLHGWCSGDLRETKYRKMFLKIKMFLIMKAFFDASHNEDAGKKGYKT